MIKRGIALRYSKALFDLDKERHQLEKRVSDFDTFIELLKKQPLLAKFLDAPQIAIEEKGEVLFSSLKNKFDPTFFHFITYLIEKKRFHFLQQMASEYRFMVNEDLGIWEAEIITAVPIEQEVQEKLRDKLEKFYQKKMKIKNAIDPKIIGGAVLVIANEMIDWSVKGRLKKMKENLV